MGDNVRQLICYILMGLLFCACGGPLQKRSISSTLDSDESSIEISPDPDQFIPKGYVQIGDMIIHRSRVQESTLRRWFPEEIFAGGNSFDASSALRDESYGDIEEIVWPDGILPIAFVFDVSTEKRQLFLSHCADLTAFARIKCVPAADILDIYDISSYLGDPKIIVKDTSGAKHLSCGSSQVGYSGGTHRMHIGCWDERTIKHELLHSLGFEHEHTRSDRDEFLLVEYRNIPNYLWPQYAKLNKSAFESDVYDFDSIMHYQSSRAGQYGYNLVRRDEVYVPPESCGVDGKLYPGYLCRLGGFTQLIPLNTQLSEIDKQTLQRLYGINPQHFFEVAAFSDLLDLSKVETLFDQSIDLNEVYDRRQNFGVRLNHTQETIIELSLNQNRKTAIGKLVGHTRSQVVNHIDSIVLF